MEKDNFNLPLTSNNNREPYPEDYSYLPDSELSISEDLSDKGIIIKGKELISDKPIPGGDYNIIDFVDLSDKQGGSDKIFLDIDPALMEELENYKLRPIIPRIDRDRLSKPNYLPKLYDNEAFQAAIKQLVEDSLIISPIFLDKELGKTRPEKTRVKPEVLAHRFRAKRLKLLSDYLTAMRHTERWAEMAGAEGAIARRRKAEDRNGRVASHDTLTPFLGAVLSDEEHGKTMSEALDAVVEKQSKDLKRRALNGAGLDADYVILGTGVQAQAFAAEKRAENPEAIIMCVDIAPTIGGQFRSYGERPVFKLNSRNHRNRLERRPRPSRDSNINPLGMRAPLQITHVSNATYPTNTEAGKTVAANLFLSVDGIMTDVVAGDESIQANGIFSNRAYKLKLKGGKNGKKTYPINADHIIFADGFSEKNKLDVQDGADESALIEAEDVLKIFGNDKISDPMALFKDKEIAIRGGGDTAKVVLELLLRLGPEQAYGQSSVSTSGMPAKIYWFGAPAETCKEFLETVRSRYHLIADFMPEFPGDPSALIVPTKNKMQAVGANGGGRPIATDDYDDKDKAAYTFGQIFQPVDMIVNAAGFEIAYRDGDRPEKYMRLLGSTAKPFYSGNIMFDDSGYAIARRIAGSDRSNAGIYHIGPAADVPVRLNYRSDEEIPAFKVGQNTVSMWATVPNTESFASVI